MKTVIYNKKNSKSEFVGSSWSGIGSSVEVQLESLSEYSNGAGKLGLLGKTTVFTKITGSSAVSLIEDVDFAYDKRLDASTTEDAIDGFGTISGGIVDTENSGSLAENKAIRFINNNVNIKTGLGLKIYAKNLTVLSTPPSDRIYFDPSTGKFVLPRPIYWSKCESANNLITNPEIGSAITISYTGNSPTLNVFSPARFLSGVSISNAISVPTETILDFNFLAFNKGTVSFWTKMTTTSASTFVHIGVNGIMEVLLAKYLTTNKHNIIINGSNILTDNTTNIPSISHVYIIWDSNGGLSNSKTIRVFINGVEVMSTTTTFNSLNTNNFKMRALDHSSSEQINWHMDNLKIWDHVVSEDPSFEYNSGSGRESALHNIYGSSNGYIPYNLKVGYKYIPSSDTPANLPKPTGGNQIIQLENISDQSELNCIGYFGTGHRISKSNYESLVENIDYTYNTSLSSIYDTNNNGDFSSGKYLRVIHNGVNLSSLGLTPIAKKMTTNNYFPPSGQFYIDPSNGKIALPRPVYWSKMTSANAITTGMIGTANFTTGDQTIQFVSAGFGTCLDVSGAGFTVAYIWPNCFIGNKGTLSFWGVQGTQTGYITHFYFGSSTLKLGLCVNGANVGGIDIYSNGTQFHNSSPNGMRTGGTFAHGYLIWDRSKSLSGNKSIKYFQNGSLVCEYDYIFDDLSNEPFMIYFGTPTGGVNCSGLLDNIKIWDHVVSEDPEFEYNSSDGREDALHNVYGSSNDYKPYNLQVGYYKSSSSGNLIRGNI